MSCNRKFAMSAEETLATAQSLYEKKLLTYPRVEPCTYLSEDIYPKVAGILRDLVAALPAASVAEQRPTKARRPSTTPRSPITTPSSPQGSAPRGSRSASSAICDLVARHFIAAFYPDCLISTTSRHGVERIKFKVSGKEILLPRLAHGLRRRGGGGRARRARRRVSEGHAATNLRRGRARPPAARAQGAADSHRVLHRGHPYCAMETAGKFVEDEELREAMKRAAPGRPSTRANIIETLFKRGYIEKVKRSQIHATETGKQLIGLINCDL